MRTESITPPGIPEEDKGIFDGIKRFAYVDGYLDGRLDLARYLVTQLGFLKLGARSSAVENAIENTRNSGRLISLVLRMGTVSSWDELLAAE